VKKLLTFSAVALAALVCIGAAVRVGEIEVNEGVTLGGERRTTWPSGGGNVTGTNGTGAVIFFSGGSTNFDHTGLGTNSWLNGWALCNGQNGTPQMHNRFVMGVTNFSAVNTFAGNSTHTHTGSADTINTTGDPVNVTVGVEPVASTEHFHESTLSVAATSNAPPYIALAPIMKL